MHKNKETGLNSGIANIIFKDDEAMEHGFKLNGVVSFFFKWLINGRILEIIIVYYYYLVFLIWNMKGNYIWNNLIIIELFRAYIIDDYFFLKIVCNDKFYNFFYLLIIHLFKIY